MRFEAGRFETLRRLIGRSRGVTLIPESYARALPKDVRPAQVRAVRDRPPTREISRVCHRSPWKTEIMHAVDAMVGEHAPRSLSRELGEKEVSPIGS